MRKFSAFFLSLLLVISLIQTPNMKVEAYGIDYNYIDNLLSEVGFSPYYDDGLNIRLSGYDKVGSFNSDLGNVAGGRFANFLVSKSTVNEYYVITPMTKEIFSHCEYNITYCGALRGFDVSTEEGRKEAISFLASEFDEKNYNISFTLNLKQDTAFYVHPREAAYTSERTTYNGGQLAFLDINDSRINYCYINCEKCSQVVPYCCSYCPALKEFGMENGDYENEVHFPKACCYNSTALKFIDYYAGYGDVIFDEYAFAKCSSLIHIMGGSGSKQAISNWNNTTYTGGGYIYKDYAFSGCTALTHINFTTSDFTLGAYAFGKSGLQYIGIFDYDATQYNYLSSYKEYAKELIRKSNISDKAFDGVNANRAYVGHKEIYDLLNTYGDGKFFGRTLCVANINVKFDDTDTTSGTMTNRTIRYDDDNYKLSNQYGRDGYVFNGWTNEKNIDLVNDYNAPHNGTDWVEAFQVFNGETVIRPVWSAEEYKISYVLNGGETGNAELPNTYTSGQNITVLGTPEKAGYDFDGWYEDQALTVPFGGISETSTGDKTYYAKWNPHITTITYVVGEGKNDPANPLAINGDDGSVSLLSAVREGYTFLGWSREENGTIIETITAADGDMVLYAVWEKCKYAIHYELNGGDGSEANLPEYHTYGENISRLPEPVRVGYDFAGWYEDANLIIPFGGIADKDMEDHTYYAKWIVHIVTITFETGEGENDPRNPKTIKQEDGRVELYPATREGYTFAGWSTGENDEIKEYITAADGDMTLTAVWDKCKYAIHYELNGGDGSEAELPEYHTYGENVTELPEPVRVGYDFAGWYEDAALTKMFKGIPATDMNEHTYYAKWNVHVITVTYVLNGGKNHPDNPEAMDPDMERTTLYPATREGYTFLGWSTDETGSEMVDHLLSSMGDVTLYAQFEKLKFAIHYELNGGDSSETDLPEYHTYGENIGELQSPVRVGYDFAGWYEDETFTTPFRGISSTDMKEHTYYAKWIVHVITVTYVLDGGKNHPDNPTTLEKDAKCKFDSPRVELKEPVKTGYDFQYWTDGLDDSKVTYLMAANGDQTLWAVWKPHEYSIRYELNGGTSTGDAPSKYTFGKICYLTVPPVKDKYVFDGWYSDAAFTRRVYDIASGTDGDITLYAKWSEAVAKLSVPEKEGYRFLGWVDKKGNVIDNTERLADHEGDIYANWLDVRWTVKKKGTKVYKKTLKADYDWYAQKEKKGDKDSFTENSEDGSIQIYGTAHGYVTRKNISVTISGKIKSVELERDGKEIPISADYFSKKNADNIYLKGYPITVDGVYELTVSSATSSKTIIFMKDSEKPIVTGKETTKKITVSNLKEKVSHTTKTVKKKGNKTTKTVKKGKQKTVTKISYDTFEIDKPQSMYLNKKADDNSRTNYAASVSWKDSTAGVSTVYVNGKKLSAKKIKKGIYVFKKAGTYKLEIYDYIGNHYSQSIKVSDSVKDWKAPVFNVMDNATYETGVKVSCTDKDSGIRNFEITDWHGFKKNIKKKSYTIKSAGTYVLTATDKAGNSKSVKIKVVKKQNIS